MLSSSSRNAAALVVRAGGGAMRSVGTGFGETARGEGFGEGGFSSFFVAVAVGVGEDGGGGGLGDFRCSGVDGVRGLDAADVFFSLASLFEVEEDEGERFFFVMVLKKPGNRKCEGCSSSDEVMTSRTSFSTLS